MMSPEDEKIKGEGGGNAEVHEDKKGAEGTRADVVSALSGSAAENEGAGLTKGLCNLADSLSRNHLEATAFSSILDQIETNIDLLGGLQDCPAFIVSAIKEIIRELRSITPSEDCPHLAEEANRLLREEKIRRLSENAQALYKRYNSKTQSSGNLLAVTSDVSDDGVTPSVIITDFQIKAREVGKLVNEGRTREAMSLSRQICDTTRNWRTIYERGKHNFMKPSDNPDPIMRFILENIASNPAFAEFYSTYNRFLELGPGMGNDAVQLALKFPNVRGYHAVEAYTPAAEMTEARLEAVKKHRPELVERFGFGFDIEKDDFVQWLCRAEHYQEDMPEDERLIVHSKSTAHYWLEPMFKELILRPLFKIVWSGRGLLSLSMKTPESPTWLEHEPIFEKGEEGKQDGYLCGIHRKEGQLRAFITQDKLVRMLDEIGFDVIARDGESRIMTGLDGKVIISPNAVVQRIVVPGYDWPGQDEVFTTLLVRPKRVGGHIDKGSFI